MHGLYTNLRAESHAVYKLVYNTRKLSIKKVRSAGFEGSIQLTMNYFLKPIFCKFSNIHHSSKDMSKGIMVAEVIIMVTQ